MKENAIIGRGLVNGEKETQCATHLPGFENVHSRASVKAFLIEKIQNGVG